MNMFVLVVLFGLGCLLGQLQLALLGYAISGLYLNYTTHKDVKVCVDGQGGDKHIKVCWQPCCNPSACTKLHTASSHVI